MHKLILMEATQGQELWGLLGEYIADELPGQIALGLVGLLLAVGSLLMLLASVGLLRLPDLPTRMHASTKAGSLGAAVIMLAVAVYLPSAAVWAKTIAVVTFLLLTAPVAAHVIGRASYFVGVPLWSGTVKDELADQYDFETHTLRSGEFADRVVDMGDDEDVEEFKEAADEVDEVDEPEEPVDVYGADEEASDQTSETDVKMAEESSSEEASDESEEEESQEKEETAEDEGLQESSQTDEVEEESKESEESGEEDTKKKVAEPAEST